MSRYLCRPAAIMIAMETKPPTAMDETFLDQVTQNDPVTAVRRLIIGGLMAASTPFGLGALSLVSVSMLALNSFVFKHDQTVQQKKLLRFYKDEIAALQQKPVDSLTIDDLKHVAAPVAEGGHGNASIQHELDEMDTRKKVRFGASTVSSAITSGILIGVSLAFPTFLASGGIAMVFGLGLIGFGYTAIAKTVRAAAHEIFGAHDTEHTVSQHMIRIGEEIKEKPVTPVELFSLFVDANPTLQERIQTEYHAKFSDLPVIQKTNVVEAFEPEMRVIALTNAINNGDIKPSFVGFIAGGHADQRLPDFTTYKAMFDKPVDTIPDLPYELAASDVNLSGHRTRLIAEREMAAANKAIH